MILECPPRRHPGVALRRYLLGLSGENGERRAVTIAAGKTQPTTTILSAPGPYPQVRWYATTLTTPPTNFLADSWSPLWSPIRNKLWKWNLRPPLPLTTTFGTSPFRNRCSSPLGLRTVVRMAVPARSFHGTRRTRTNTDRGLRQKRCGPRPTPRAFLFFAPHAGWVDCGSKPWSKKKKLQVFPLCASWDRSEHF